VSTAPAGRSSPLVRRARGDASARRSGDRGLLRGRPGEGCQARHDRPSPGLLRSVPLSELPGTTARTRRRRSAWCVVRAQTLARPAPGCAPLTVPDLRISSKDSVVDMAGVGTGHFCCSGFAEKAMRRRELALVLNKGSM